MAQSNPFARYAAGTVQTSPAPPDYDLKRPGTIADIQHTQAQTTNTGAQTKKIINDTAKDNRGPIPSGYQLSPDGKSLQVMPGFDPSQGANVAQRNAAIQAYHNAETLDSQIKEIENQFRSGPGQTKGIWGLEDYNPLSTSNQLFNNAGTAPRGLVGTALGFTGGQLNTPQEAAAAVGPYLPQASDRDVVIQQKIDNLKGLADRYRQTAIQQLNGVPDANGNIIKVPASGGPAAPGSGGPTNGGGNPPPFNPFDNLPGGPGAPMPATGATKDIYSPEASAIIDQGIRNGWTDAQINQSIGRMGFPPIKPEQSSAARAYLKAHPNYKGLFGSAIRQEPTTAFNRTAASPLGTGLAAFANGMTAGTTDEIAGGLSALTGGDYTQARDAFNQKKQLLAAENPTANLIGTLAGGSAALAAPELALGKLGIAANAGRVFAPADMALDTAYSSAYGAGENNANRLGGAIGGGISGLAGGVAGRGIAKGVGKAIAPSGGDLASLYANGVRPTIGQRFGTKGPIGRALNVGEQALQSVPGAGALVYRARNIPREQFQIGAFNNALSDIGERLPKEMRPGTDPHAYAQQAFNREYDAARSGLNFVADPQYQQEFGAFAQTLDDGVLDGPQVAKVNKIIDRAVNSRMKGGQMSGDGYKAATSAISSASQKLSRTDPLVADALEGYTSILDNAARRNSSTEAVARLDNADRGYAKLVRIEDAAARRGGDTGEFTPTGFDAAIQKASRGVRSREYLRGDALMSDYGRAGKALVDTLPNSGTADRLLTGQAAMAVPTGAAGYAVGVPTMLKAAPIFTPYVPGINAVTGRLLSPRESPALNAIGKAVQKRTRLGGIFGAPLASQLAIGSQ